MSSETKISLEPIAEAIALEAGRIIYGLSYVAAMKRQGFGQAIFAQPRMYLELGCPLEYVEAREAKLRAPSNGFVRTGNYPDGTPRYIVVDRHGEAI